MRVRVEIPDERLITAERPDLEWLNGLDPAGGWHSVQHYHDGMVYEGEVSDILGGAIIALARGELHAYRVCIEPCK